MGCIAQVLQDPVSVMVPEPMESCCCNNIITPVDDVYILMKQINVNLLRGKVCCGTPPECPDGEDCPECTPVAGAIVVATDGTNYFVGITNADGEYSICVPNVCAIYEVQAYCCCSCNGDLCEEVPCNCGCNGE